MRFGQTDIQWMEQALDYAHQAKACQEVPIGAVVVHNDQVIAGAHNETLMRSDPTAHAEILAIQRAAKVAQYERLDDCILYVTLEPCMMCLGAVIEARLRCVKFAAYDQTMGQCSHRSDFLSLYPAAKEVSFIGGILAKQSQALLQTFFQEQRQR